MNTIKSRFDGKQIVFPECVKPPVGEVLVLFAGGEWDTQDPGYLASIQEAAAKVWDNSDDDIYNDM